MIYFSLKAISALALMPSETVFSVLEKISSNWKNYHEIRSLALAALASISSTLPHMRNEVIAYLLGTFEAKYGIPRKSIGEPILPRPNSFDSFPAYFIQNTILRLIGKIKDDHGKTPPELIKFLLQMLRFNDNSQNMVGFFVCFDANIAFRGDFSMSIYYPLPFPCLSYFSTF